MKETYTLDELAEFARNEENEFLEIVGLDSFQNKPKPRKHIIDNLLNFSKALSVRETRQVGEIQMVLN